jgi:predicted GH43/DUF377 family glycosyl hydrolase
MTFNNWKLKLVFCFSTFPRNGSNAKFNISLCLIENDTDVVFRVIIKNIQDVSAIRMLILTRSRATFFQFEFFT